ncbi:ABC multidrug transporter SitT [Xylariales sp. PMI_506]|nr:ABC multidrug transporter SitT [Xylariales sp. PMI_506]
MWARRIGRGYFRLLFYAEPTFVDIALLVVGTLSAIAAGVPFPLIGIIFGQLLDNLNAATCADAPVTGSQQYQDGIDQKVLIVVYLAIAQFGCIYLYIVSWNLFGDRLAHRLRAKYFQSILKQEVSYFDKLPAGDVSSRLVSDINTIKSGTSEKVGVVVGVLSMFVTAYIVAFVKYAKLAGILISLLPAFVVLGLVGGHFVAKFSGLVSKHMAAASSVALEGLSNIMVVQAFRANSRLEQKFNKTLRDGRRDGFKKAVATSLQSGLLYFLGYAANGMAYWQGSRAIAGVVSGTIQGMSVGTTYTIIFVIVDGTLVLSQMAPFIQIFAAATAAFARLEEDINRQSQIDGTVEPGLDAIVDCEGTFKLEKVSFSYPSRPHAPVIQDVSLRFPAGKHTAVVGLSGSGKSTIAGFLTRLYDPDTGMIYLDGKRLRNLNARQLRGFIGIVQQDPSLLNRSILENIALGLVNSPRPTHKAMRPMLLGSTLSEIAQAVREGQEIRQAALSHGHQALQAVELVAHAANLADARIFLDSLEYGMGTIVGPNGDLLSGGQKQRVALARALVKDPKILVLDEATSSLDSASEQRIQAAIQSAMVGRTVISIAHRLSTVKSADNIVVMRGGHVIEQGTHPELLAKDGDYASMVRLQNMDSETSSTTTKVSREPYPEASKAVGAPHAEFDIMSDTSENDEVGELAYSDTVPTSNRSAWQTIKSIGFYARPHLLWLLIAFTASVVIGAAFSSSAVIFGNTVGALSPCNDVNSILRAGSFFGLMFFTLAIIELLANGVSWSSFGYVSEKILYTIRALSFRSLLEQDVHWHQSENRSPSGLLNYITTDSNAVGGLTGSIIGTMFSIAVNFIIAVILSDVLAWRIALVCLAIVPLMLGAGFMQLHILAQFAARHEKAFANSVGVTVESVTAIKTVAALSLEHEVLATYQRSLRHPRKDMLRTSLWANMFLALTYSISNLIYALAYWWGSKQIIDGYYNQTDFFIVLIALLVSAQQWGQLFTLAPEVASAGRAAGRIFDLIDLGSTKTHESGHQSADDLEADVELKNVPPHIEGGMSVKFNQLVFSYPARPHRQVLKGLDLEIKPGQFCALVGPSGAGKSTIISLLERMYHPESGSIEVDGVDITARKEPVFRDDIGLVPQDNVLFDGSIRFNIALGARPVHEPSDSEIEEACRLANMHDTIMALPDDYDTQCGPGGGQLSGGQKQRLAIARALVRKPRLLLLDESTSALDAESERLLQEGLERATKGVTVVAIAHRLNTIRRADVIFLVENGKIVDKGSHEELLKRSESYRVNVLHQTLDR